MYASKSDSPFVNNGFSDWKHAGTGKFPKDKQSKDIASGLKGFAKQSISCPHDEAMKRWEDHKKRSSTNLSVNTMVLQKIPEHQKWVETVFNIVRFLAVNGLPFRRDVENTDVTSEDFGWGAFI